MICFLLGIYHLCWQNLIAYATQYTNEAKTSLDELVNTHTWCIPYIYMYTINILKQNIYTYKCLECILMNIYIYSAQWLCIGWLLWTAGRWASPILHLSPLPHVTADIWEKSWVHWNDVWCMGYSYSISFPSCAWLLYYIYSNSFYTY